MFRLFGGFSRLAVHGGASHPTNRLPIAWANVMPSSPRRWRRCCARCHSLPEPLPIRLMGSPTDLQLPLQNLGYRGLPLPGLTGFHAFSREFSTDLLPFSVFLRIFTGCLAKLNRKMRQ